MSNICAPDVESGLTRMDGQQYSGGSTGVSDCLWHLRRRRLLDTAYTYSSAKKAAAYPAEACPRPHGSTSLPRTPRITARVAGVRNPRPEDERLRRSYANFLSILSTSRDRHTMHQTTLSLSGCLKW